MRKFQDGDLVRTVNHGNSYNNSMPDGMAFTVTGYHAIKNGPDNSGWYEGDPDDWGVWESRLELLRAKSTADITEDTTVTYFKSLDGSHWSLCYEDEIEDSLYRGYAVKKYTMYRKYTVEILGAHDG